MENITWSELGKQNLQAKKVYSSLIRVVSYCIMVKMAVKFKDLYGNSGFNSYNWKLENKEIA